MSCVNSIDFLTKFPNYIGLFIFKFEIHGLMLERILSKLKGYLFFKVTLANPFLHTKNTI